MRSAGPQTEEYPRQTPVMAFATGPGGPGKDGTLLFPNDPEDRGAEGKASPRTSPAGWCGFVRQQNSGQSCRPVECDGKRLITPTARDGSGT